MHSTHTARVQHSVHDHTYARNTRMGFFAYASPIRHSNTLTPSALTAPYYCTILLHPIIHSNAGPIKAARPQHDDRRSTSPDDAGTADYKATEADQKKLRKVKQTLYKKKPPVTGAGAGAGAGATVAGLRCINVGREGIEEPVETGIYCCWSGQPPPSGGAVPSASYIQAVVFVCEMEFESEVPDELLSSLRVAYEVRSAADSNVVLSEEGAEVTLAVNREDGVYDAVLLAGSGVLTADDVTFLGRHLQCTSLQTEKSIADFCESSSETRCFVLFEGVSEELKQKVHGQEVPVIRVGGGAVDLQLCLRSVLAHCIGGRETIVSEIKERCVRDGESNLPIVASAAIDVMDPFDERQTLVDKVIVTAQYRIPQLLSLPTPSDTPRELASRGLRPSRRRSPRLCSSGQGPCSDRRLAPSRTCSSSSPCPTSPRCSRRLRLACARRGCSIGTRASTAR